MVVSIKCSMRDLIYNVDYRANFGQLNWHFVRTYSTIYKLNPK